MVSLQGSGRVWGGRIGEWGRREVRLEPGWEATNTKLRAWFLN